jgi:hypothetical protein
MPSSWFCAPGGLQCFVPDVAPLFGATPLFAQNAEILKLRRRQLLKLLKP